MNRKSLRCLLAVSVLFVLSPAQEEPIKETVSVVNVDVSVRVFDRDNPVKGLTREDFRLYEDGRPQTINGFFVRTKKLTPAAVESAGPPPAFETIVDVENAGVENAAADETAAPPPDRYFVLVFEVSDFNQSMSDTVREVFDTILRSTDQVLVFVNEQVLSFDNLEDKAAALAKLESLLGEQSQITGDRLKALAQNFEKQFNISRELGAASYAQDIMMDMPKQALLEKLRAYETSFREYKKRYLQPSIDTFYNFARQLEKIRKEKWVISFYQFELFPSLLLSRKAMRIIDDYVDQLKIGGLENEALARMLENTLASIDKALKVADDFPSEEISKLFYKVDATFHTVFIPVVHESDSDVFDYQEIANGIENVLRRITQLSGGRFLLTRDAREIIGHIVNKEDYYYCLTYAPAADKKIGKIKVEIPGKRYKVFYDNNQRADYISEYFKKLDASMPTVKIKSLTFAKKTMSLAVAEYARRSSGSRSLGRVNVHVLVSDSSGGKLFDESKDLMVEKETFSLSLDFDWLTKGDFDLVAIVTDLLTQKTASETLHVQVK